MDTGQTKSMLTKFIILISHLIRFYNFILMKTSSHLSEKETKYNSNLKFVLDCINTQHKMFTDLSNAYLSKEEK